MVESSLWGFSCLKGIKDIPPAYTEKNAHKDLLRILLEFKITYISGQLGVI